MIEAELFLPPFPKALAHVWTSFVRLRRRTAAGFSGASPIGWRDIESFVRMSGVVLHPWQVGLIEALDDLYLEPDKKVSLPEGQTVLTAASSDDVEGVKSVLSAVARRRVAKRKK